MSLDSRYLITRPEQLDALFDPVPAPSLKKEVDYLHPLYRQMIAASPFFALATSGPDGLDVSPRGDPAGFVVVEDEKTLLLPERRGNNRIDSLRNMLTDPRVALLFMIPGIGETLRVNGRASISNAPDLLERFVMEGKPPKCVIAVRVEPLFFQCARAIKRANLWQADADIRSRVPTPGAIHTALGGTEDGAAYDREVEVKQRSTLY